MVVLKVTMSTAAQEVGDFSWNQWVASSNSLLHHYILGKYLTCSSCCWWGPVSLIIWQPHFFQWLPHSLPPSTCEHQWVNDWMQRESNCKMMLVLQYKIWNYAAINSEGSNFFSNSQIHLNFVYLKKWHHDLKTDRSLNKCHLCLPSPFCFYLFIYLF